MACDPAARAFLELTWIYIWVRYQRDDESYDRIVRGWRGQAEAAETTNIAAEVGRSEGRIDVPGERKEERNGVE